jgi:serine/threonine-protein kinase
MAVQILGKYQLLEQIGQGGMATVYRAVDPGTNSALAIKVLNPFMAQDPQFGKRFEREAEVVMRLKHPNIVPIVDYGQDKGYAYLVMPLLKVGSLADRLREGPLSPLEGGRVVMQLSGALQLAHGQGVVHRDVKPSNLLLDEQGNALLSDFGLARIHDASVSLTGSALLGTPAYMSPEQARGEKVGPASDQYSLGVILYQLCTGHLPFEAETPMAVMLKHINEPVPPVRLKSPNVPEVIERVIQKATAKKPEERFESVTELNTAFQAALAHAQNPFANPAPLIEVPPSSIATPIPPVGFLDPLTVNVPQKKRNRLTRLAAVAALLLLLFLACPLSGSPLSTLLQSSSGAADASILSAEDLSGPQLTALAGTIESLSTQLAESGNGTQSPEQIQTAVMGTLIADAGDDGLLLDSSGTPIMILGTVTPIYTSTAGPSPTATKTATPGPSPTASKTPTPGPSPTASNTPTITYTPTDGPSPTPSDTPTPTDTPSPTPSPTATKTPTNTPIPPTPTKTPTKTPIPPAPTRTPTRTPTPNMVPSMTPSGSPSLPALTPSPPTPTPFSSCSNLGFGSFWPGAQEIGVDIWNMNTIGVKVDGIHVVWAGENGNLVMVNLAGSTLWENPPMGAPPPELPWTTALSGNREIPPGGSKSLVSFFAVFPLARFDSYFLQVHFDNGCIVSGGT